uniref:Uncharacterized protein n=1 Tax=Cucumis sativus TaxID=3659 RepID=A0A0A0KG99_CUCSA
MEIPHSFPCMTVVFRSFHYYISSSSWKWNLIGYVESCIGGPCCKVCAPLLLHAREGSWIQLLITSSRLILKQETPYPKKWMTGDSLRNSGPSSRMAVWIACAKLLLVFLPTKSSALIDSISQSVLKTTIKIETTHAI